MNAKNRTRWLPALFVSLCVLSAPLVAQKDAAAAKKKRDPRVVEKVEALKSALAEKKFLGDDRAIGIIDELLQAWPDMNQRDQLSIYKVLRKVFKGRKREPGEPDLYKATIVAMGSMGSESGKRLALIYQGAPFGKKPRDWVAMRELILENVGRSKDETQVKFLLDEAVRGHEDRIKAAAGKALSHFSTADFKVRKTIVKKLLVDYGRIEGDTKSNQHTNPNVITRRRTLAAIADPWNRSLSSLTGQQFRTAEEWYAWYNDNKANKKAWGG